MVRIRMLLSISLCKTLYMNFKTQKLMTAVRLPILVGRHTKLEINGAVCIKAPIRSGMVWLGLGGSADLVHYESRKNYVGIRRGGKIVFNGSAHFASHTSILVGDKAEMSFGRNFASNNGCRFSAMSGIEIGEDVLLGGNCVIRDSDGHTIFEMDGEQKKFHANKAPVKVGNHVWMANNSHVLKGVFIADHSVIAYGSIVTRDAEENNSIYAGIPAKRIRGFVLWEL